VDLVRLWSQCCQPFSAGKSGSHVFAACVPINHVPLGAFYTAIQRGGWSLVLSTREQCQGGVRFADSQMSQLWPHVDPALSQFGVCSAEVQRDISFTDVALSF
jgi:hypothetical protein